MDITINCSRVPSPQAASQNGTPGDVGPAPANIGLESDPVSLETYDEVALNLSRRVASDAGQDDRPATIPKHNRILKCTHTSIFSTFNVRTLAPKGRFEELVECSSRLGIDVIAIQEHRFYHPEANLEYRSSGAYHLVTSSATENASNASIGGVGFYYPPKPLITLLVLRKSPLA